MNLTDFLLLLFDKATDRYPDIRYSFLRCWNTSEIVNILAITNYRCSQNEFKKYIYYTCEDKGVTIRSLGSPPWSCKKEHLVDMTIYSNSDIEHYVIGQVQQWMNMIIASETPIVSILDISSSNSEFNFSFIFSANGTRLSNGNIAIEVSIIWSVVSKANPRYEIDGLTANGFGETSLSRISIHDNSIFNHFIVSLDELTKCFSIMLTEPIALFKKKFIQSILYSEGSTDIDI